MAYRRLPLTCRCGGMAKQISGIGLSSTHALVIEWRCPRCRKNVCIVKPLSDCWRDCIAQEPANTPRSNADSMTETPMTETPNDRKFLHSVGIRYSDE